VQWADLFVDIPTRHPWAAVGGQSSMERFPFIGVFLAALALLPTVLGEAGLTPDPLSTTGIGNAILQGGALAALVWYCYYTTSKLIPDMQTRFDATIQNIERTHRDVVDKLVAELKDKTVVCPLLDQKEKAKYVNQE